MQAERVCQVALTALTQRIEHACARWELTRRQREVLEQIVRGSANKEIAAWLDCGESTVELHVTALLAKARATTRAQLTAKFWLDLVL